MKDVLEEKEFNEYGQKASMFKKIKYLLIVLLVFVVLFFLVGYREDITVENIRYLLKYVDVSPRTIGAEDATVVKIDVEGERETRLFRSDIVALTGSEVKTYDLSGKEGISSTVSLSNPTLSCGKDFFAVFDMGENYYALYNSFSKVYDETTTYPIWDVVIGDTGSFAVITAEKGYRSALKVYNSDFENKMNWYTADKYIIATDMYTNRDTFIAAGCVQGGETGDFISSLTVLRDGADKVWSFSEFAGEMLLDVKFFDNSNIALLTDTALRIVDLTGKVLETFKFKSDSLRMFDMGDGICALILNENSIGTLHRLIIYDESGNTCMDTEILSDIRDVSVIKDTVFLLGSQTLVVCEPKHEKITSLETDKAYVKVMALSKDRVVLLYGDNAYIVTT